MVKKCQRCRAENNENNKYCDVCNTKFPKNFENTLEISLGVEDIYTKIIEYLKKPEIKEFDSVSFRKYYDLPPKETCRSTFQSKIRFLQKVGILIPKNPGSFKKPNVFIINKRELER